MGKDQLDYEAYLQNLPPEFKARMEKDVARQRLEEKYSLNPVERNQKLALKKGSTQLHGCIWDFIENRAIPGSVSAASIIRGYVFQGVRMTIAAEIDRLKHPISLKTVRQGIVREFRRYMAEQTIPAEPESPTFYDDYDKRENLYLTASLNDVIDYYKDNPEAFEAHKKSLVMSFMVELTEDELIHVLSEGDY